jgi:hypothetical protein
VSDLSDLQAQVLARRAELLRAYNVQVAAKPTSASTSAAWNDLSSRAWDFSHESASWLNPTGQDDRGRKLLAELYAMFQRFKAEGIGLAAMPAVDPTPPPGIDPSHASEPTVASLFGDAESLAGLVVLALVLSAWREGR